MGRPRRSKRGRKSNPSNNTKKQKNIPPSHETKKKHPNRSNSIEDNDPILFGIDHSTEEEEEEEEEEVQAEEEVQEEEQVEEEEEKADPEDLQRLLEAWSKEQLITFLIDAVSEEPSLLSHIRSVAEEDIAHRKLFIRGIGWDVTTEALLNTFRPYGTVVDCNVVVDKASGRNKGYGFVVFSNRSGAMKALKVPEKRIGTRMSSCQLASTGNIGPPPSSSADLAQRRVYVSNVHADASPEKLKALFAAFGEIENGPSGYDTFTGKSRGFAIFVYKTQDGAARALQEPYKMFEGHQLHCKLALDHSQKGKMPATLVASSQSLPVVNQQQPAAALNAMAAAQSVAMLSHNPAYNMLFFQNPLLTNAALNQNSFAGLNPAALSAFNPAANLVAHQGLGYGAQGYGGQGYGGVGVGLGGSNLFGTYRTPESAGLSYGGTQFGQSSSVTPATGFFRGFPQ